MNWHVVIDKLNSTIGIKIILPYLLLTLVMAGVGVFMVTNLVTETMQERLNNQLLDAGRVVSERMVDYEEERLETLRRVAHTEDLPGYVAEGDVAALAQLTERILAGNPADVLVLVDRAGETLLRWDDGEMQTDTAVSYAQIPAVAQILQGYNDAYGDRRVFLSTEADGRVVIYTVGPIRSEEDDEVIVGAALVGSDVQRLSVGLTESAIARVTLYDSEGQVVASTLSSDPDKPIADMLRETPARYDEIITRLHTSPEQVSVITAAADQETPLRRVEVLNQTYQLGYGDWQLRDQSFGLFSVALPRHIIVSTAAVNLSILSAVFVGATVGVFLLGVLITWRIVTPLGQLVSASTAVAQGDLERRSEIRRRDEIGELARSFDTMTDHLAERNRQLIKQASELEAILHSITDGMVVFDMNRDVIAANPAARRILPAIQGQIAADGQSAQRTAQRYLSDGRVYSALYSPVRSPDGEPLGQVVVLRDITREAEAERLKDEFITGVSHELRTPLTSVKGYVNLLLMTGQESLDAKQTQFLHTVNDNTDQLIVHVNSLIEITEMQNGDLTLKRTLLNLTELIQDRVEAWRPRFQEKNLALVCRFPDAPCLVEGDEARLEQVVDNLLDNARLYTFDGRVTLTLTPRSDTVQFTLADTGVGLSEADQAYLFTRFFRAQNEATFHIRGMGLGLFTARAILEAHDGRIWAESALGEGSAFHFELPLAEKVPA